MPETAPRRGRPAAATRSQILDRALHHYLRGRRIDVQSLAAELGVGRTTIYRWFGSREELLGEVLFQAAEPLLDHARSEAKGRGGRALLETFDRFNRIWPMPPRCTRSSNGSATWPCACSPRAPATCSRTWCAASAA